MIILQVRGSSHSLLHKFIYKKNIQHNFIYLNTFQNTVAGKTLTKKQVKNFSQIKHKYFYSSGIQKLLELMCVECMYVAFNKGNHINYSAKLLCLQIMGVVQQGLVKDATESCTN